jgi:acetylornithine deacetylase/succinyl-diaminopimelate desuccinylase-like protein
MADLTAVYGAVERERERFIADLQRVVRQPSISTQRIGVRECAELLVEMMGDLGIDARVMETAGLPVVFGEIRAPNPDAPTLVIYNHYDVQPPEPLELWDSPPYAGEVRDGRFYARGVADDRGDLLARVQAIRAYQAAVGDLPIRLRWLIEGEEEIGSPNLASAISDHADELRADWCAWEGAGRNEQDLPMIVCGVKGILYVELHATGPDHDAHSGLGGVLPNPAWRLVMALSTLRDAQGNFVMDGLEEIVVRPTEAEMRAAERLPFDEQALAKLYGVKKWQRGLQGRDVLYASMFEPTANIAGFTSGYSGEGSKTIVPSKAMVKIDFRLVPNQTPAIMRDLLRAHLDRRGYDDVEIVTLGELEVAQTPVDSPLVQAALDAWTDLGAKEVALSPRTGGSGPMSLITAQLGIPTVVTGGPAFSDSRVHSPNESIRLEDYRTAIRFWGRFFSRLASL